MIVCLFLTDAMLFVLLKDLHRQMGEKEYVVEFDFLGKDSIHYHNLVEVEKRVSLSYIPQGSSVYLA